MLCLLTDEQLSTFIFLQIKIAAEITVTMKAKHCPFVLDFTLNAFTFWKSQKGKVLKSSRVFRQNFSSNVVKKR